MDALYRLMDHGAMIGDRVRTDAYARALHQAVKPGAVVVDIGTGTGFLACLACRAGAKTVYAIEPDDVIEVAREIARVNGLADHIAFIQKRSTQVTLHEEADVIVSDLGGVLPLFQHHLPSIVDARRRFLKQAGVLIPQRHVIWAAVADAPDLYEPYVAPWERHHHDLDMRVARWIGTNDWRKCRATRGHVLLKPQRWATIDFATIEHADLAGTLTWSASRGGTAHGVILWFDADLSDGVGFSNEPGALELIYGQAFFPWPDPVSLDVGDTVSVVLDATLVGDDYIWSWETCVREGDAAGRLKAEFHQSSFFAVPLSPAKVGRRAADHIPSLNDEGGLDQLILGLLDAHVPLGSVADHVLAKFPTRFSSRAAAMSHVADLSVKYSQ